MKRTQHRRNRAPFESTLAPLLYLRIEQVCNGWTGEISSEDRLDIIVLIRSLPLKQRVPLVLKAQGYDFREIAQLTGRTLSAVHGSYRRAENRLRRGI